MSFPYKKAADVKIAVKPSYKCRAQAFRQNEFVSAYSGKPAIGGKHLNLLLYFNSVIKINLSLLIQENLPSVGNT